MGVPTTLSGLMDAWPSILGAGRAGDAWITGFDVHGRLHVCLGDRASTSTTQLEAELRPRLPTSLDGVAISRVVWHRKAAGGGYRLARIDE